MQEASPTPSFWSELKRRHVIRVAITYLVAGFVVIEAADILLPALNLQDWTVTLVVALTFLGFPIALALAWAFDMTPSGVVRSGPFSRIVATSGSSKSGGGIVTAEPPASPEPGEQPGAADPSGSEVGHQVSPSIAASPSTT